jgi:hypothetical protein
MGIVTAEEFRRRVAGGRKTEDVEVGELGTVRLRALSASDLVAVTAEIQKIQAAGGNPEEKSFELLARSWVDDSGEPLFPLDEGESIARSLAPESFRALSAAVVALNGMGPKAVEDAEKNSGASRSASTRTGSRKTSATRT